MFSVRLRLGDTLDPHQRRLLFRVLFHPDATVLEGSMAQTTIAYLERRYAALEKIADALSQSPTDELAIADLKYRKLIIADEIQHDRRLVERFSKLLYPAPILTTLVGAISSCAADAKPIK
jgi:hypothetical protein